MDGFGKIMASALRGGRFRYGSRTGSMAAERADRQGLAAGRVQRCSAVRTKSAAVRENLSPLQGAGGRRADQALA